MTGCEADARKIRFLLEHNATGAVFSNVFANGQLLATFQFPTANWTFALNDWLGTKRVVANADGTQDNQVTTTR